MTKVEEARSLLKCEVDDIRRGQGNGLFDFRLDNLESAIREEERAATHGWCNAEIARLRNDVFTLITKRTAERVRVLEEVQRRIGHTDSWSGKQVAEMLSEARASGMVGGEPRKAPNADEASCLEELGPNRQRHSPPLSEKPTSCPGCGKPLDGHCDGEARPPSEQPEQERCPDCGLTPETVQWPEMCRHPKLKAWHSRKEDL